MTTIRDDVTHLSRSDRRLQSGIGQREMQAARDAMNDVVADKRNAD